MKPYYVLGLMVAVLSLSGCGGAGKDKEAPMITSAVVSESAPAGIAAKTVDSSTVGIVKGKILFEGVAPAVREIPVRGNPECAGLHPGGTVPSEEMLVNTGGLQNVFVYVKEGLEGYSFPTPQEAVTIENKGCMYVPHVSGVRVGQAVNFLNQDSTLHNIHSYPKNSKPFNLGLPVEGMKQSKKFDSPEIMVPLKCDVHPWMQGYLGVLEHPYFAVSDENGAFEIKNLPPGNYTLEIWHEKLGVQSQKIQIEPQAVKDVEFKFSA